MTNRISRDMNTAAAALNLSTLRFRIEPSHPQHGISLVADIPATLLEGYQLDVSSIGFSNSASRIEPSEGGYVFRIAGEEDVRHAASMGIASFHIAEVRPDLISHTEPAPVLQLVDTFNDDGQAEEQQEAELVGSGTTSDANDFSFT